jgi:hypothetical protein
MMGYGGTVSVLRASCDSTEEGDKYKRKGVVASLEILLHAIYYLSPQTYLSTSVNRRCDQHPETSDTTQGVKRDETTPGVTDTAKTTIPHRV